MKVAIGILLALAAPAAAESPIRLHTEVSLHAGYLVGETRQGPYVTDDDGVVVDARLALGAVLGRGPGINVRLGVVGDFLWSGNPGKAFGIEAQVDREIMPGRRAGVRLSGSFADGASDAISGQMLIAGLRLRSSWAQLSIDGMFVRRAEYGIQGHTNGILIGVGTGARPGKYVLLCAAATTALVGTLAFIALLSSPAQ